MKMISRFDGRFKSLCGCRNTRRLRRFAGDLAAMERIPAAPRWCVTILGMNGRARRRLTLGDLDFRSNSIGFLRFFFAATVVWSHAFPLGGFSEDPLNRLNFNAPTTGFLAVGGFFVLSGFLITRSYETVGSVGRFIWHRFLRIFPAFWVCLMVTAFGLAPLAFAYQHGTLHHYFTEVPAPWSM